MGCFWAHSSLEGFQTLPQSQDLGLVLLSSLGTMAEPCPLPGLSGPSA